MDPLGTQLEEIRERMKTPPDPLDKIAAQAVAEQVRFIDRNERLDRAMREGTPVADLIPMLRGDEENEQSDNGNGDLSGNTGSPGPTQPGES